MVDPSWLGCPGATPSIFARFNKKTFDPQKDQVGTVDYELADQRWFVPDDSSIDIAYTVLESTKWIKISRL
jgi:hypothetical protein